MSIGHRLEDDELSDVPFEDLRIALGERTTAKLLDKSYKVDTEHDIPFGAGNSVDRKTIYIDRELYTEAMDNAFAKTGLEPEQVIERWLDHEHTEKCIIDGDNPIDAYFGGHRYALAEEHHGVLVILGMDNRLAKIRTYEAVVWPALVRCYKRTPKKVPLDLWCSPLLDDPEPRDEEIIKILKRLGVKDAAKRSKYSTHYGLSGRPCRECTMWEAEKFSQEGGDLAPCTINAGLVRENRSCDFFQAAKDKK